MNEPVMIVSGQSSHRQSILSLILGSNRCLPLSAFLTVDGNKKSDELGFSGVPFGDAHVALDVLTGPLQMVDLVANFGGERFGFG